MFSSMMIGAVRALQPFLAGFGTTVLFVMAIVAGSVLGSASPAAAHAFGACVDDTVRALVGLLLFEVRVPAITQSWTNVRFLSLAWVTNFVMVPTIGFAISSLFLSGQPLFFTGLVIYFMAPCTDWFLGFTRLAGGNTALGAVLLPINMISQLLLYPVYLFLFVEGDAPVDVATIGESLAQWFLVPLLVALAAHQLLRRFLPETAFSRLLAWVGYAIPCVVALLIAEIFTANIAVIGEHASVFAIMLVATFLLGELVSTIAGLAYPEHALLTMTTAARNAPMMLGVTAIAMPDQQLIYAATSSACSSNFRIRHACARFCFAGADRIGSRRIRDGKRHANGSIACRFAEGFPVPAGFVRRATCIAAQFAA